MGKLKRIVLVQKDTVCFNIDDVIDYQVLDNGIVKVRTTKGEARFNERGLALWQVIDMPIPVAEDFMNEPVEGEM